MTLLAVDNLSFKYKSAAAPALSAITLSLGKGERVGLMGPSGAGKSTLLLTFNGLIPQMIRGEYSGEVRVKGRKTTEGRIGSFADSVGLVFQDFEYQLFASTVEMEVAFGPESLSLPREEVGHRIDRALDLAGIAHLRYRTTRTLSGGEKQRLAIAAVQAMRPALLCYDEATTDLDPSGKEAILSISRKISDSDSSLVVVEQDADALLGLDRVLLIDRGKVVADGPSDRIFRDPVLLNSLRLQPPQMVSLFEALSLPERPITVEEADRFLTDRYSERGSYHARPEIASVFGDSPSASVGETVIEINGLSSFYGENPVLRGIDLKVRRGECLAIVGPNGSGKSTLLKHMNGLLLPQTGEVRIGGTPTKRAGLKKIAERVGYVFQNPDHQIFANTLFDEVAFGLRQRGVPEGALQQKVEEALSRVGLIEKILSDPFALTRGERQRLAVASVLVNAPDVVLLDEPTTGLDPGEIAEMVSLIRRLRRDGCAIVMVTHALRLVAEETEKMVVLKEGRVLCAGSTRETLFNPSLLSEAALKAPPIVALSERRGLRATSVAEFVSMVGRPTFKEGPHVV